MNIFYQRKDQNSDTFSNFLSDLDERGLWDKGQPLRLHLGCGENHLNGYVNIDYPPSEHTVQTKTAADIFVDITTLNCPEQSVDEIRLHHIFEHFNRPKALALLIKWHEWLKIGGRLHIETPDIIGCAKLLVSNIPYRMRQAILRHCFGSHEADWAYHLDGWYDEKFRYILTKLGFSVECRSWHWQNEPFLANVEAIAIKIKHLSHKELLASADEILKDSMVADVSSENTMHNIWCGAMRSFLEKDISITNQQALSSDNIEGTQNKSHSLLAAIKIYLNTTETDSLGYDNDRPESNGEYHLISRLIKPGDTVFDVGANVGNWSRHVLFTIPDIHLYSFEPVPQLCKMLRQNLSNIQNVSTYEMALSDENSTRTFFYYNKSMAISGMSSFYRRPQQELKLSIKPVQLQVHTQTLDSFCETYSVPCINFLKIDTEGGDFDVLRGAKGMLWKERIAAVQFEYGGTYPDAKITLKQTLDFLMQYKYSIFRILPDGLLHISQWHDSLENYRYANYLAVASCDIRKWSALKTEGVSADESINDTKN